MFKKHIVRSRIYFAVAALGLVTAWVLNALAVTQEADYLNAWFGSYVDWVAVSRFAGGWHRGHHLDVG